MRSYDEKKKAYIKLHGQPREVEEIYTTESITLRLCYGRYDGVIPINIESSIFEKALDFCKRRAETRNLYAHHDQKLLQDMLKDFDSDFHKQYQNHDDAIGLVEAAAKLDIKRLYDLLFEDVVHMIDRKTPQEIEKIFTIRYDGDDKLLEEMEHVMETAVPSWAWKEKKVESNMLRMKHESKTAAAAEEEKKKFKIEIIKVSPADFKNLDYQQKQYWVHAHYMFKANCEPVEDDPKSEEFKEEEEEDEEEEVSKVPKKNDDHGGCGPRGASWKRTSKPDDDGGSGPRADI